MKKKIQVRLSKEVRICDICKKEKDGEGEATNNYIANYDTHFSCLTDLIKSAK